MNLFTICDDHNPAKLSHIILRNTSSAEEALHPRAYGLYALSTNL